MNNNYKNNKFLNYNAKRIVFNLLKSKNILSDLNFRDFFNVNNVAIEKLWNPKSLKSFDFYNDFFETTWKDEKNNFNDWNLNGSNKGITPFDFFYISNFTDKVPYKFQARFLVSASDSFSSWNKIGTPPIITEQQLQANAYWLSSSSASKKFYIIFRVSNLMGYYFGNKFLSNKELKTNLNIILFNVKQKNPYFYLPKLDIFILYPSQLHKKNNVLKNPYFFNPNLNGSQKENWQYVSIVDTKPKNYFGSFYILPNHIL